MGGLRYQFKNLSRDKMCILTFLLPILAGLFVSLLAEVDFQSVSEASFGAVRGELYREDGEWLQSLGSLTWFETMEELAEEIKNPSTQMIGVKHEGEGIETLVAGDELGINRTIADFLPKLYEGRNERESGTEVLSDRRDQEGLKSLLLGITLVTAMFMGCTFNAMNIIGEKEEGISFLNQILPMSAKTYIFQKLALGFLGGCLSTGLTAFLCIRLSWPGALLLTLVILMSIYLSSMAGLFIGWLSQGLMTGIVSIKVVLILFLTPPIFCYLLLPKESLPYQLSRLIPSSPAFYGLMELMNGQGEKIWMELLSLAGHVLAWSVLYAFWRSLKDRKVRRRE